MKHYLQSLIAIVLMAISVIQWHDVLDHIRLYVLFAEQEHTVRGSSIDIKFSCLTYKMQTSHTNQSNFSIQGKVWFSSFFNFFFFLH